jgi:hypothetical protein
MSFGVFNVVEYTEHMSFGVYNVVERVERRNFSKLNKTSADIMIFFPEVID